MDLNEKYEIVIGLEVHAQLSTKSKVFCADDATFGAAPNTQISPVTLGYPGVLPKLNEAVVEYAVKLGLGTNCSINKYNEFARKNYFYADLPKGYQISQFEIPICIDGHIDIKVNKEERRIGVTRIHIEEDAGKSMHDQDPYYSLVDLNRAGVPLLEIVSEPDLRSSDEAYQYLTEVRKIVRHLEVCDGNMEEGSMRCDANVSVRLRGAEKLGERTEVKNLNSLRNVKRAIDFEAKRQMELLEKGIRVDQQTRSFDANNGTTFSLRSKEDAHDYRYFPDPDLPPVQLTEEYILAVQKAMPALPQELFKEYTDKLGLSEYDAGILSENKDIAFYFNELTTHTTNYKAAANWIIGPVKSYLNERAATMESFPIGTKKLVELLDIVESGKVSFSSASQKLFAALLDQPNGDVLKLAEELNLIQESDAGSIQTSIDGIIQKFPDKVADYRSGKTGLMGFFMGQLMKATGGKIDPKVASGLMSKALEG